MQGVVELKDVKRAKEVLNNPDSDPDQLLETLNRLAQKEPSTAILKSTKIGWEISIFVIY